MTPSPTRLLADLVNGTASVTDAQKLELGLTVRAMPSPIPATAPVIEVISVSAWTVRIRLRGAEGTRRGKPAGTIGASVFSFVGAEPPAGLGAWKFEGSTGRVTKVDIAFDNALPAGTKVWLTAFWFNPRKQSGPPCAPVTANLPGGGVAQQAA